MQWIREWMNAWIKEASEPGEAHSLQWVQRPRDPYVGTYFMGLRCISSHYATVQWARGERWKTRVEKSSDHSENSDMLDALILRERMSLCGLELLRDWRPACQVLVCHLQECRLGSRNGRGNQSDCFQNVVEELVPRGWCQGTPWRDIGHWVLVPTQLGNENLGRQSYSLSSSEE